MKLSEFKNHLSTITDFNIALTDGQAVPAHFHITEMGLLTKNYIDCGNTIREEQFISFQVWFAADVDHRLLPAKVFTIINAAQPLIGERDVELEVEYQMETTMGKFGLEFDNGIFILTPKETTCLAQDHCGIPADKMKVPLGAWKAKTSCCTSDSNCC